MKKLRVFGRAMLFGFAMIAAPAAMPATDPSLDQVYGAVQSGQLSQAQGMMDQVLRDHPNSAKAHYVEAEILAKQGRGGEAQAELNRAEQLAPGLPFVSAFSVRELRGLIAAESGRRGPSGNDGVTPAGGATGFPWAVLLIALVLGVIVFSILRARRNAAALAPYGSTAVTPAYGQPAPYGAPPMGGGMGSGIMGGLATGAAIGAGMVAGEALAHDLIDRHGEHGSAAAVPSVPPDADLGGQDFGINDAGSWDDGGGIGGGGDWN